VTAGMPRAQRTDPIVAADGDGTRTTRAAIRGGVLIADDQQDVLTALKLLLRKGGFEVQTAGSPAEALAAICERRFDAALIDLNYARDTTSGREGLDLLGRVKALDATLPVVVMTAWGSIDLAVEAMRLGARDFIEKPWDNQRLLTIVRNQVELALAVRKGRRLAAENALLRDSEPTAVIAESPAMRKVLELVERVAPSDAAVLLTGENGTGKGLIARLLHRLSRRAQAPLIVVNMGSVPESVFESEMFGHVRGAFTDARSDRVGRFELADGGTLMLDEIANLPLSQQPRLLRVVENGEFERVGSSRSEKVDVRLVAATNADLPRLVEQGAFRQDLLFRLNTIEIELPPLRARAEDVQPLARHFLLACAHKHSKSIEGLDATATEALRSYAWPGNVRELGNVIERAVLMSTGSLITAADLRIGDTVAGFGTGLEQMTLEEAERVLIRAALRRADHHVPAAARALGLSRSAMYRRMEKLGIGTDGS